MAAVPTVVFFRAGKVLERVEGAKPADVTKIVRSLAGANTEPAHQPGWLNIVQQSV